MICSNCTRVGVELEKSFTKAERMYTLASAVAMLRSIESGRNDGNDKIVANSVITKTLLSFSPESRQSLIEHFERSMDMRITLGGCPHGITILS